MDEINDIGNVIANTIDNKGEDKRNFFGILRAQRGATDLDHIHILIECSPQHFIPNILKIFKGISARKLFLKHPEIKNKLWNGHLWNPSYFVATVSENTEEQIKRYIQTQKER